MKIVVENIFMCLVLFWKCYFLTKFSRFLSYFLNIQTNFITENFKIIITTTNFSRFLGYFLNATTTPPQQQQQKSKSQREIGGSKIGGSKARSRGGEIEQRQDRRRDWAARCWINVWFMVGSAFGSLTGSAFGSLIGVWFMALSFSRSLSLLVHWALSFFGSLSLLRMEGNGLKVKWICKMISESNEQNFNQTEIIFRKFYFP